MAAANKPTYEQDGSISQKIVLVGNSGVGKTALVLRYVKNTYDEEYPTTIGGSYLAKKITVDNTPFKLQIWDTAGQERFRSMVRIYYRGAAAAILVFDVTRRDSFDKLKEWVNELHSVLGEQIVLVIACNKMDLVSQRAVSRDEIVAYAKSIRATVHETSAATKQGVEEMFTDTARRLLENIQSAGSSAAGMRTGNASVSLVEPPAKKGCCG